MVLNAFDVFKRIGKCIGTDVFLFDESGDETTKSENVGKEEFQARRDTLPDAQTGEYLKVEDTTSETIML